MAIGEAGGLALAAVGFVMKEGRRVYGDGVHGWSFVCLDWFDLD